jgi:hypothetical protein
MCTLAAALALSTAPAAAQPPISGAVSALPGPSIVCDTQAQLRSIVAAFELGAEAGEAKFVELFTLKNTRSEPTCAIMSIGAAMTVESTSLGMLDLAGGQVYGWIVHIANEVGDGYYLHLESPAEALRDTI